MFFLCVGLDWLHSALRIDLVAHYSSAWPLLWIDLPQLNSMLATGNMVVQQQTSAISMTSVSTTHELRSMLGLVSPWCDLALLGFKSLWFSSAHFKHGDMVLSRLTLVASCSLAWLDLVLPCLSSFRLEEFYCIMSLVLGLRGLKV